MNPPTSWNERWPPSFLHQLLAKALLVLVVAAPAFAAGSTATDEHEYFLLRGVDVGEQLAARLVGRGIAQSASPTALVVPEGEVVWRAYRDETDQLGIRHVFYQQTLMPGPALTAALGEPYASDGIPIEAAHAGVHIRSNGTLRAVAVRQVRDLKLSAMPTITNRADAFFAAHAGLRTRDGISLSDWRTWSPDVVEAAIGQVQLRIADDSVGNTRLRWDVPTKDEAGMPYLAALDAATGVVTAVTPHFSASVCDPGPTQVSARGIPQNYLVLPQRSIWAKVASDRPPQWTHEGGRYAVAGQLPSIEVYVKVPSTDPLACTIPSPKPFGIMPVTSAGATPVYDEGTTPWAGRSTGDAVFHTNLTMKTLKQKFGMCGFAGSCGHSAMIVMHEQTSTSYLGYAYYTYGSGSLPCFVPERGCVVVSAQGAYEREASASLDVMAHEWGHGVIRNTANFPVGGGLDEGFANVVGHATEWANQPAGKGFEKADWCFGEDHMVASPWPAGQKCPKYWSVADEFRETTQGPERYPNGSFYTRYWAYHKDHTVPGVSPEDGHFRGHMLLVVMRLLADGGSNPICGQTVGGHVWATDCLGVIGQGAAKASKILMAVLTGYALPSDDWAQLPDYAKLAAFDLYESCSNCPEPPCSANSEQHMAALAFGAIGYPGDHTYETCP